MGPYTIGNDKDSESTATLHAMTMVDPATGWFKIAEIPTKTADIVIDIFKSKWLTQYPYPVEIAPLQ